MNNSNSTPIDREINFQSVNLRLAGSLMLPNAGGPFPAVLLLPGSGEVDRNENHKKLPINALREIAEDLARRGIASLRYDKRGVGASEGDHFSAGLYDHVDDAAAALAWLKTREEIQANQVFLLGHSEGSALVTRLAGTGADIAGLILLAGWAKNSEELLLWQGEKVVSTMGGFNGWLIRTLHIDVRKAQTKQFVKLKRTKKDWYRQAFVKINAKWLREFLAYTPADDLVKIKVPVLAITGSKDIQVDPAEVAEIKKLVQGEFEGHVLPEVSHLLRTDTSPGLPSTKNYPEQIKRPVDVRILQIVGAWLEKHIQDAQ